MLTHRGARVPREATGRGPSPAAAGPPGPAGRTGAPGERGSVTVYTVVFAVTVIFLLGLILDGGIAMNAKQRAADIAGQAARAAADHIDLAALRSTGRAVIGAGACVAAQKLAAAYGQRVSSGVDRNIGVTRFTCAAPAGSRTATVQITIRTRPLVPGVLGGFSETSASSATVECGINQGGACG